MICLVLLAGCGATDTPPEGFSATEWQREKVAQPGIAQAHLWINRDARRRRLRAVAAEASFRAYAHSRVGADDYLEDFKARKAYYRAVNTTWLPEVALRAQRGEGEFSVLLAQTLREEAGHCWNRKSAEILWAASRAIAPSAP